MNKEQQPSKTNFRRSKKVLDFYEQPENRVVQNKLRDEQKAKNRWTSEGGQN